MNYLAKGTNSVVPGQDLSIDITISREDSAVIKPADNFSIEGLEKIVSANAWRMLKVELWGKTATLVPTTPVLIIAAVIPENPGTINCMLGSNLPTYVSFEVRIFNAKGQWPESGANEKLTINFYDDKSAEPDDQKTVPYQINKVVSRPVIKEFFADKPVLRAGSIVILSWELDTENCTVSIADGSKTYTPDVDNKTTCTIEGVTEGNHSYTLSATKNNVTVTESITVRALGNSQFSLLKAPGIRKIVGNVCVANDSGALFSLILKTDKGNASIDCIGYSNDGFSGNWNEIKLSDEDKNALKPYALSPLIHLKNRGETLGRLYFIGGSSVIPTECYNSIAVVDLQKNSMKEPLVKIIQCPWKARMGHRCVIFPHGSQDKIWLMGGIDEYSRALNDVWVSANGEDWENVNELGEVNTNSRVPKKMNWAPRYYFGAAVQYNTKGIPQALWIGGGFNEVEGAMTPDVWMYKQDDTDGKMKWQKAMQDRADFKIDNETTGVYNSSALAFGVIASLESTGMYAFGGRESGKQYFNNIKFQDKNYSSLPGPEPIDNKLSTNKNSTILTLYFKGCLWYMVLTNDGDNGVTSSGLYYWIPPPSSTSFIL